MILYRDDRWLVVNKPEGLATHAGRPGELGVVEWLELHHGLKTHVVSRLDRGTSGALLLALTPEASKLAQEIHEQGTALKTYEFYSTVESDQEHWDCRADLDGKSAHTEFSRLEIVGRGLVRYQARISRGRKHQIRRHAASSGVPILGDRQYGSHPHGRLCLHCRSLQWPGIADPSLAPLPPSFLALAAGNLGPSGLGMDLCRDRRLGWLPTITEAFRVVHRDEIQGLPAAVDIYGEYFDAIWFDEQADSDLIHGLLDPILEKIQRIYGCRGGVVRVHRSNPHQRTLVIETRVIGQTPPDFFVVKEHGLSYEISLTRTQHTGLFLDQRDTRRRLFLAAENKRLANLFAYTCSFSVAAVSGGAEVAFSVDLAKRGLNTGRKNFQLNGLTETGKGKFIQEDARKWLERQWRRKEKFDLMVCDPPVFASSKKGGKFALEKEWPRLAESVSRLLGPGGQALFANNHRTGNHSRYRRELAERFDRVWDLKPPLDFPVAEGRAHHVRIFWCFR